MARHGAADDVSWLNVSQLRLNPLTGRWVTIVAERAERPTDFAPRGRSDRGRPVVRARSARATRKPRRPALETVDEGGSWRMRVVPNLYPAFDGDDGFAVHHLGPVHVAAEASGIHEVFVFSPDHDGGARTDLDDAGRRRVDARPQAAVRRARQHPHVRYTQAIVNHGPRGRRVALASARAAARPAVRARRGARRGARLRPLRRRLHAVHHDRGRARRRRAGRRSPTTTSSSCARTGADRRTSC